MFSYLRPHRRAPSTPTSPVPDQTSSWEGPAHPTSEHAHPQRHQFTNYPEQNTNQAGPPILPQVTRVPLAGHRNLSEATSSSNLGASLNDGRSSNWDAAGSSARVRDDGTNTSEIRPQYSGGHKLNSGGNAVTANTQYGRQQDLSLRQHVSNTGAESQNRPGMMMRKPTGFRSTTPPPGANQMSTFEAAQSRPGKRLNLLNPMSLLARRRTSQAVAQLSAESLKSSRAGNDFNEFVDPRIKGTRVHDFSAPRPRRIVSTPDVRADDGSLYSSKNYQKSPNSQAMEATSEETAHSPWSGGGHTPVFTEDFEEEQYPAAGRHVRKASDFSDLTLPNLPYAKGVPKKPEPSSASQASDNPAQRYRVDLQNPPSQPPPPIPSNAERKPTITKRVSKEPVPAPLKSSPSSAKTRSRNVSQVSAKDIAGFALPKHMKSTSSRFSFDMIGAAEQERLLEDRHRQRALEKKNEGVDEQNDDVYEDDYDYDNMDDDDGLEERIPGVNADYDEEYPDENYEEDIPGVNADIPEENEAILDDEQNIAAFTFQDSVASPLSPYSPGIADTPRDAEGQVIGFAMTNYSPYPSRGTNETVVENLVTRGASDAPLQIGAEAEGLHLQHASSKPLTHIGSLMKSPITEEAQEHTVSGMDDDDLYFDDGLINELGDADEGYEFDESVFDNIDTDEYGRPLKVLTSQPTLYNPPNLRTDSLSSTVKPLENTASQSTAQDSRAITTSPTKPTDYGPLAPQPSLIGRNARISAVGAMTDLTQDKLAAYQIALAEAAFNAAANGKFRRGSTLSHLTPSEELEAYPGHVADSSLTSNSGPFSPSYDYEEKDDFDYDDALEDDDIIAAANAEALAYDADGFYGQEFGFYSAPAGEAEYVAGGYFGPRGTDGINRTQSGRVASREPNLTPITERSEYSNRNSFMFGMHRPESLVSPGLAQLIHSPDYEGDMSLNALLRLRRGAWGGSQASLHSSNGSPAVLGDENNSPVGQHPPWQSNAATLPMGGHPLGGHRRASSALSLNSEGASGMNTGFQSENSSAPGSPTLTMSGFAPLPARRGSKSTSTSPDKEKSERESEMRRHRHTTSAESISYLKEEDPQSPTGERWILERKRTSESGAVEILGREVVSGGI